MGHIICNFAPATIFGGGPIARVDRPLKPGRGQHFLLGGISFWMTLILDAGVCFLVFILVVFMDIFSGNFCTSAALTSLLLQVCFSKNGTTC